MGRWKELEAKSSEAHRVFEQNVLSKQPRVQMMKKKVIDRYLKVPKGH